MVALTQGRVKDAGPSQRATVSRYQESPKAVPSGLPGGPTVCQLVCTWRGPLVLSVDV